MAVAVGVFSEKRPLVPPGGGPPPPPSAPPPAETVIHKDATFKGDLSFEGTIRIEGRYEGKIAAKGRLVVGKGATVTSDATVGQAFIEGVFKGNINALEHVELAASAQVSGDIASPRLVVAEGALLVGKCTISRDGKPGEAPKK